MSATSPTKHIIIFRMLKEASIRQKQKQKKHELFELTISIFHARLFPGSQGSSSAIVVGRNCDNFNKATDFSALKPLSVYAITVSGIHSLKYN